MNAKRTVVAAVLFLLVLCLPVMAGDLIQTADRWIGPKPGEEPTSPDKISGDVFRNSNIRVVEESYDKVWYVFENMTVKTRQPYDAAKVVGIYYENWPQSYREALTKLNQQSYREAIQGFSNIADSSTQDERYRVYSMWYLGQIYQVEMGDLDNALRVWEQFQKLFPKHRFIPQVIVYAGEALLTQGKVDEARDKFLELQRLPGLEEGRKQLAQYYVIKIKQIQGVRNNDQALLNQALTEYRTLLGKVEKDESLKEVAARARLGVGECMLALGQHQEAVQFFQKLADSSSDSTVLGGAFNGLGRCYFEQKKWKEALMAYLHTVVLYDKVPEQHANALAGAGASYVRWQGEFWKERARGLLTECTQRYPGTEAARAAQRELDMIR